MQLVQGPDSQESDVEWIGLGSWSIGEQCLTRLKQPPLLSLQVANASCMWLLTTHGLECMIRLQAKPTRAVRSQSPAHLRLEPGDHVRPNVKIADLRLRGHFDLGFAPTARTSSRSFATTWPQVKCRILAAVSGPGNSCRVTAETGARVPDARMTACASDTTCHAA